MRSPRSRRPTRSSGSAPRPISLLILLNAPSTSKYDFAHHPPHFHPPDRLRRPYHPRLLNTLLHPRPPSPPPPPPPPSPPGFPTPTFILRRLSAAPPAPSDSKPLVCLFPSAATAATTLIVRTTRAATLPTPPPVERLRSHRPPSFR